METVIGLIERDFYPEARPAEPTGDLVEITDEGYLHLPARLAASRFPADVCVARIDHGDLVLLPLVSASYGGLVLKQRNPRGDRSLLVSEVFGFSPAAGIFAVAWEEEHGALRVLLTDGEADGDRGPDRGGAGARPVDGVPAGPDPRGHRPPAAADLLHPGEGAAGGRRDPTYGGPETATTGGTP